MRLLAVAAAIFYSTTALANGRPPVTNGLHFRPGDSRSLYVAATFGLLISHDEGCTFRWICEQSIGYGGTFDPKYRIAADGAIFATTYQGLRVSRDNGCTFTTAPVNPPADPGQVDERSESGGRGPAGSAGGEGARPLLIDETWIDAIDIGPTGHVWVATADSGKPNNVYRSTDNGLTFEPRGMLSQAIWWKSILVAPSRAQRIYLTGYQVAGALDDGGQMPPTAHFAISDDDGATWTASPLAGVAFGSTPTVYVVGVDHTNPDIVLMSSRGANPPNGDRLYRSSDGGMTWTEVLVPIGPILDLTVSRSGNVRVAATGGAYESTDRGATFGPMANPPQLACVGERPDGTLFGCGANWEPDDKAVARSSDGKTWDKVFRFVDLAGPVECPAGTPQHDICESQWPALQTQFGSTGPTCGAPVTPDATPPRPAGGGCCDTGRAAPGQLAGLAMLVALCGFHTLRRRRRA
jgi:hypothetical protein